MFKTMYLFYKLEIKTKYHDAMILQVIVQGEYLSQGKNWTNSTTLKNPMAGLPQGQ